MKTRLIKLVALATTIAFTSGCATTSGRDIRTPSQKVASAAEDVGNTVVGVAKLTGLIVAMPIILGGYILLAGAADAATSGALADAATSRAFRSRSSTRTKIKYDRNGQIGWIKSTNYEKRIRYNRDGRIREIKTRYR